MKTAQDEESVDAIAARLKRFREAHGWSQVELCRRANIATNVYNQWEKAQHPPSLQYALTLRRIFNISLDWLYCGDTAGLPMRVANLLSGEVVNGSPLQRGRNTLPKPKKVAL